MNKLILALTNVNSIINVTTNLAPKYEYLKFSKYIIKSLKFSKYLVIAIKANYLELEKHVIFT